MPYVPYCLLEKSKKYLDSGSLTALLGRKVKPSGFVPDLGINASVCIDYLSLTVRWSSSGICEDGLFISHSVINKLVPDVKDEQGNGVDDFAGYRKKILAFFCLYIDKYFSQIGFPLDKLLNANLLDIANHRWEYKKGKNFYTNSLTHASGVSINYSNPGDINSDTINIVFPGSSLRLLNFSSQVELLYKMYDFGFKSSRIDLAYDDFSSLTVDDFVEPISHGNYFGVHRKSINLNKNFGGKGDTIYLGSRTSEKMMRVYNAGVKHCPELINDLPFNWTRLEVEYKGEWAKKVSQLICDIYQQSGKIQALYCEKTRGSHQVYNPSSQEFELVVFDGWVINEEAWGQYVGFWRSCLASVIDFRDRSGGETHLNRCPRLPFWEKIIDGALPPQIDSRNAANDEKHPIFKSVRWLRRQVASTLLGINIHCAQVGIEFNDFLEFIAYEWMDNKKLSRIDAHLKKYSDSDGWEHNPLAPIFLGG